MNGSWEYHVKLNKSDGKSQEPNDFTQMWDIKLKAFILLLLKYQIKPDLIRSQFPWSCFTMFNNELKKTVFLIDKRILSNTYTKRLSFRETILIESCGICVLFFPLVIKYNFYFRHKRSYCLKSSTTNVHILFFSRLQTCFNLFLFYFIF